MLLLRAATLNALLKGNGALALHEVCDKPSILRLFSNTFSTYIPRDEQRRAAKITRAAAGRGKVKGKEGKAARSSRASGKDFKRGPKFDASDRPGFRSSSGRFEDDDFERDGDFSDDRYVSASRDMAEDWGSSRVQRSESYRGGRGSGRGGRFNGASSRGRGGLQTGRFDQDRYSQQNRFGERDHNYDYDYDRSLPVTRGGARGRGGRTPRGRFSDRREFAPSRYGSESQDRWIGRGSRVSDKPRSFDGPPGRGGFRHEEEWENGSPRLPARRVLRGRRFTSEEDSDLSDELDSPELSTEDGEVSNLRRVKDHWAGEVLFGINPVLCALKAKRRRIEKLCIQEGSTNHLKQKTAITNILDLAREHGVELKFLSKHELNELSNHSAHQGVLLDCSKLPTVNLVEFPDPPTSFGNSLAHPPVGTSGAITVETGVPEAGTTVEAGITLADKETKQVTGALAEGLPTQEEVEESLKDPHEAALQAPAEASSADEEKEQMLEVLNVAPIGASADVAADSDRATVQNAVSKERPPLWIALDEVTDPHNLGAILRSAHFLGLSGVVVCTRNSAPLSPVVSKSSAGAMEHMTVWDANKLQQTLAQAKNKGWQVLGAAVTPEAVDCSSLKLTEPTVLVLGSEGAGLRTNVRSACTQFVRINGYAGQANCDVDSLNVSVAAGVLMHQLLSSQSS